MGSSVLWTIVGVLIVLWLLGYFIAALGNIVHILLVLAVVVVAYKMLTGRGARV